ncbi:omptin family outer membrane protease [Rhizobium sp. 18065]|uniref:omptin family outer membrane protease n=1 Tax=Rhizobium sp. 18065 TaxID=2681411 RepID=UPI00135A9C44|nr:omptin family outer membrane protease [Rhizobium sp. 18065]
MMYATRFRPTLTTTLLPVLLLAMPVAAVAQDRLYTSSDGAVSFQAGLGIANIKAGEYVYDGDHKLSQLDWESKGVKVGTLGTEIELGYNWRMKGRIDVGFSGNGEMEDRDWLDYSNDDWTHQSLHPDTKLGHYVNVTIEADHALVDNGSTRIALGGGAGYTDVKWKSYGGSYIYSSSASSLYDTVGTFDPDEKGISYRQKIPVAYLSASAEQTVGAFSVSGSMRGGVAFGFDGVDDHWMRDLRFFDEVKIAPMVGATASLDYRFLPMTSIYLSGSFDKMFEGKGDTRVVHTPTSLQAIYADTAGADYQILSVSMGLKGKF